MGHIYSGNHPRFSMAKPSPLKDSTGEQHKHYMDNAVHDLEKGDKVAGEYEAKEAEESSSFKNIGKALTPGAAIGHPGSGLKKGGEVMYASVSSAVKNVLGPDKPHSHSEEDGKVVMDNAMKLKTNQSGGGMLASDSGAAGRELVYNQSFASGVKKKKEHKGY